MTRYTVRDWNTYFSIPWYVTALTVVNGACSVRTNNVVDLSSFKIVNCPRLKSLYIRGNSCYRYNWFELAQLPQLKSIVMGFYDYGCFVRTRNAVFRGKSERTDEL